MIHMKKLLLFPTLLIFLLSCSGRSNNVDLPVTITSFVTSTPNRLGPALTISPTTVRTSSPTIKPASTLKPDESLQAMEEILKENQNCALPCVWGIVPGKSSWEEVKQTFLPLGEVIKSLNANKIVAYQLCVPYCRNDQTFSGHSILLYVRNEIVVGIATNTSEIDRDFEASLSNVLNTFGSPDEIWIRPIADSLDNQPYYDLSLYYKTKGIEVSFNENARKKNDLLEICPQQLFTRTPIHILPMLLFDSGGLIEFEDIELEILGKPGFWKADEFLPLEAVSVNFTIDEFVETYSRSDTATCFDVHPIR